MLLTSLQSNVSESSNEQQTLPRLDNLLTVGPTSKDRIETIFPHKRESIVRSGIRILVSRTKIVSTVPMTTGVVGSKTATTVVQESTSIVDSL